MPEGGKYVLKAGAPGTYIPGAVPDASPLPDDDMWGEGDDRSSRKKQRTGAAVDVETFKMLLAEQAAKINEAHRHQMADMMQGLRQDLDDHKEELRQEIKITEGKVDATERKLQELATRVTKLESSDSTGRRDLVGSDERHRFTLVYGGWPRESARKDILKDIDSALGRLDLKGLIDHPAFTTGPRRSLALQTFQVRPNETYVGMRNRMSVVIAAVANTSVSIGGGEHKMWASYSRSKEARANGDHCAWIRRTIRKVAPMQEDWLEVEYAAGGAWFRGKKIASAVEKIPEGLAAGDFVRDDAKVNKPWIHVTLLAELLDVGVTAVRAALDDTKR